MKVKQSVILFLLGSFRERPGMYLGRNHLSLLSVFMGGYLTSLITNGFDPNTDPFYGEEGEGFFGWYSNASGIDRSANWYATILEQANHSEEKGLELFLSLLEEFAAVKGINV